MTGVVKLVTVSSFPACFVRTSAMGVAVALSKFCAYILSLKRANEVCTPTSAMLLRCVLLRTTVPLVALAEGVTISTEGVQASRAAEGAAGRSTVPLSPLSSAGTAADWLEGARVARLQGSVMLTLIVSLGDVTLMGSSPGSSPPPITSPRLLVASTIFCVRAVAFALARSAADRTTSLTLLAVVSFKMPYTWHGPRLKPAQQVSPLAHSESSPPGHPCPQVELASAHVPAPQRRLGGTVAVGRPVSSSRRPPRELTDAEAESVASA